MTEIEKAIEFFEYINRPEMEDVALAISALHEKAEREKGCEYCKGLTHGGLADGETMRELETRQRILQGYFCPMCGRKLGENDG